MLEHLPAGAAANGSAAPAVGVAVVAVVIAKIGNAVPVAVGAVGAVAGGAAAAAAAADVAAVVAVGGGVGSAGVGSALEAGGVGVWVAGAVAFGVLAALDQCASFCSVAAESRAAAAAAKAVRMLLQLWLVESHLRPYLSLVCYIVHFLKK